ncbi:E3 ubiquitin-protein ligase rififylin isoform X1 [Megalops cyprinoides]|uniref:E3 ubiquitin-protein ligase rififylin isoform X1 n=1 Tax=Megalops cyprinoides TaxID=118141 RepID=UPI00186480F5|nr:E3 ubiquitin-protein ligase rififylin isoform X1 [Megalops cyprinoides]XP_036380121.1 E3 ubiquitin-protein ligase rififylin isoform X1 [Megalops cyprinoides]
MWMSCCSWHCVESTATATVEENGNTRRQAYTNSGYSPSPTAPEPLCKACGGRFNTIARKHVCVDCKKNFCGRCSVQLDPRPRLCHTCQRFHGTFFDRTELMRLKVKDLRDYLHLHEVPTQMCREKEELVDLVLGQQTPSSSGGSSEATSRPHTPPPYAAPSPAAPSTPPNLSPADPELEPLTQDNHQSPPVPVDSSQEEAHDTEVDMEVQGEQESQSSDTEETGALGRRASLSNLSGVEDIEALSVRQLKEILARNFVNYKGCCEKWELMERVTRLYNDQKDLHNLVSKTGNKTDPPGAPQLEENLCKICMDLPIDCVLLECGHMVTCTKCGKRMSECPICRQYVVRAVHVFRS